MIELKGITKQYPDGFKALKNINLQLEDGQIHVIIGPSGCGKSTTMKLINRLIEPSEGKVLINGDDISSVNAVTLRRKIGYVIQNIGLFPHMTIADNVAVVPRLLKWEEKKTQTKVDELLNMVHLAPDTYRNRKPKELSGGQQQRIGVIRALAAEPDIILMDEPFSALDPISREQLQAELIQVQESVQKTIVFVTHDMDEAIKIADNIILMKDGEVIQTGSPDDIIRHPANEFVKTFIGKKRLQEHQSSDSGIFIESDDIPTVQEVMVDNPATAYPERGLAAAIKLMEQRKVDSLLVVDRERKLIGYAPVLNVLKHYQDETKVLKDVMNPVTFTVEPDQPFTDALEYMGEHNTPYVPVVSKEGRFLGVITRGSMVRLMADVFPSDSENGVG
ncbi:ABC transporter ATP-binding protein [Alkalicoccobacillus plakortidis]|uniref:Quaternary amine transport ATP-binding protein n=1 Tax=Alkalicoccobacillus plakortidis TaxID=444060 RepID=A0ABT0XF50_9BACI|nr:betaine/proline/choline family ABC transporter ATP-binding protein [Alkalicoccobacillus plakortidis]MCM2674527.1 betaine/proline/choline family ABC transporter ATP-binding protein [Alkalicoccobacillus plakortidis]